ncbi:MAG: BatD family protein [Pirellulales bacterium]|nr:BatD family protein [Pirellulales bacterium]
MAIATSLLTAGCDSSSHEEASLKYDNQIAHTENGQVHISAQVDRDTAHVAERINLTFDVRAPRDISVRMPDLQEALGPFEIMNKRQQDDLPDGKGRRWTAIYELECLSSGTFEIPAIDVSFTDRRAATAIQGTVRSQPIEIQIVSALEGQSDPLAFRDIKGEIEPPAVENDQNPWIAYSIVGSVAVALAALGVVVWRRSRREKAPAAWALAELEKIEKGDFPADEFYCRLTDVVRGYLERQFAIHAPRLTTDEFLVAMHDEPVLAQQHRESLRSFLAVADMVKFARYEPGSAGASETIDTARQFVLATADYESADTAQETEVAA